MLIQKYDYTPLSRETVNGKRHYCLPDGSKVASVTTILDKTKPQESVDALNQWRARMGQQKAQEITTEAANRGTRMHTWLETFIKTGILPPHGTNPYSKQSQLMAKEIISKGLPSVTEIWGVEVPLYYSGLYAGTADGIGVHSGKECIFDFKQANKPKKKSWIDDYFCQVTAYGLAHNAMFGTNIQKGVIMICVSATIEYQEFILEGDEWNYYANEWARRVEQYYF